MKKNAAYAAIGCLVLGFIYRILPHPPNITPVAAMALVGGLYFNNRILAFLTPIVALYCGDLILNNTVNKAFFPTDNGLNLWSDYMLFGFIAMAAVVLIGERLRESRASTKIIGGTLAASIAFFLLTNTGSWLTTGLYTKDITGLGAAILAGVPFFRNSLISNLFFITLFIGIIEYVKQSRFFTAESLT